MVPYFFFNFGPCEKYFVRQITLIQEEIQRLEVEKKLIVLYS